MPKMDTFTKSYIYTMLWSTNDESDEAGGEPLDRNYDISDIAPDMLARIVADCAKFQADMADTLGECLDDGQDDDKAGSDFWFTRNRHGVGFWDGGWPEPHATTLTDASDTFGEVWIYVGDDGRIHGHDGESPVLGSDGATGVK